MRTEAAGRVIRGIISATDPERPVVDVAEIWGRVNASAYLVEGVCRETPYTFIVNRFSMVSK